MTRPTRVLTPVEGQLAATFREAMRLGDEMRAKGVSKDEREVFVAQALKAAWPKGREEPWHYVCEACGDMGWRVRMCASRSCGRPFKLPGQSGEDKTGQGQCREGHTYAEPCMCAKGQQQRRLLWKERAPEDAIAVAAKSRPTRVGR